MIKPGLVCMIRGVPNTNAGYGCNGKIVKTVQIKKLVAGETYWLIDPPVSNNAKTFTGVREKYLHPLDPCEDDLAREQLDQVLETTFLQTLEAELRKI